jgi:uncharacterized membrane protein
MTVTSAHLRLKTRVLAAVVIVSNVLGNFFLSRGVKGRHSLLAFDGWVVLGVALLILWMLSRMTLLSWADLSYVLPVTALGYVLTVFMGRVFLLEQVSWQRWAGTLLIMCGVLLVDGTPIATTRRRKAAP